MRSACISTLCILASLALPLAARATPGTVPKVAIHLATPSAKNACTRSDAHPTCGGLVTSGRLYPYAYFAYVLVMEADSARGVIGASFGISYDNIANSGVDIYSWNRCADLEFPTTGWPESGSGNMLTWNSDNNCQKYEPGGAGTGVVATTGYFYCTAYSADELKITLNSATDSVEVTNCGFTQTDTTEVVARKSVSATLTRLGKAAFSSAATTAGWNPCGH